MMRTLLTGATGFLGNVILTELKSYPILTLGRHSSDIICDLSADTPLLPQLDLVIHCAGRAHLVPTTPAEQKAFFDVNVQGTRNLLTGLEKMPYLPKSFVFISTIAVYGLDKGTLISEESQLLANDPYGKSKIEAEKLVKQWCRKHNVICAILRLPLIAGPNPPGNLGAMIHGIQKGYYFNIGKGDTKKSIVLASDVAGIIPLAAAKGGTYNLTDGYHPSFTEIAHLIAGQLAKSKPFSMPLWLAKLMGAAGDLLGNKAPINTNKLKKITSNLTFDDSKAVEVLGWKPTPVLKGFKIK